MPNAEQRAAWCGIAQSGGRRAAVFPKCASNADSTDCVGAVLPLAPRLIYFPEDKPIEGDFGVSFFLSKKRKNGDSRVGEPYLFARK